MGTKELAGDRWMAAMAKKNEDAVHAVEHLHDNRKEDAVLWVEKQMKRVRDGMMQYGHRSESDGLYRVTFGELFREAYNFFPALSGSLRTAKRRGLVSYAGPSDGILQQGKHDGVEITLLRDDWEPVDHESVYRTDAHIVDGPAEDEADGTHVTDAASVLPCRSCGRDVFPTERIVPSGNVLHRSCFVCAVCATPLVIDHYAFLTDKYFCLPHYRQLFLEHADYGKTFAQSQYRGFRSHDDHTGIVQMNTVASSTPNESKSIGSK